MALGRRSGERTSGEGATECREGQGSPRCQWRDDTVHVLFERRCCQEYVSEDEGPSSLVPRRNGRRDGRESAELAELGTGMRPISMTEGRGPGALLRLPATGLCRLHTPYPISLSSPLSADCRDLGLAVCFFHRGRTAPRRTVLPSHAFTGRVEHGQVQASAAAWDPCWSLKSLFDYLPTNLRTGARLKWCVFPLSASLDSGSCPTVPWDACLLFLRLSHITPHTQGPYLASTGPDCRPRSVREGTSSETLLRWNAGVRPAGLQADVRRRHWHQ